MRPPLAVAGHDHSLRNRRARPGGDQGLALQLGSKAGSSAQPWASSAFEAAVQSMLFIAVILRRAPWNASRSLRSKALFSGSASRGQYPVQADSAKQALDPAGISLSTMTAGQYSLRDRAGPALGSLLVQAALACLFVWGMGGDAGARRRAASTSNPAAAAEPERRFAAAAAVEAPPASPFAPARRRRRPPTPVEGTPVVAPTPITPCR